MRTCTLGQFPLTVSTNVSVTLVSQLSVAVGSGEKSGTPGHWNVGFAGGWPLITGGSVSFTTNTWAQVFELPHASVAL